MFENLAGRLSGVFDRLRGRGSLSPDDVNEAMREIRIALLEADVALPVVRDFIRVVGEKAVGQKVIESVTPGQMIVKIVHDHLVEMLGCEVSGLNLNAVPPVVLLMMGLQGSGKTTSTARIGLFLKDRNNKKVLMASVDIYRPAAQLQLEILGKQAGVDTLPVIEGERPLEIVRRAHEAARLGGYDVLLIDTAGRLHVDEELMGELSALNDFLKPSERLLVADAMTGQDALNVAKTFHEKIGVTGIVLTRMDGDARGGAALSMRAVTGCPVKFVGLGEKLEDLGEFHPERIADRILDMGDVVSLVEKAASAFDQKEAENLARKMRTGSFDLDDFASQLQQISKMGGLTGLLGMLPGIGKVRDKIQDAGLNDRMVAHQLAIIRSMTPRERRNPKILNGSRRRRIALGSGRTVTEVNRLLKQHADMAMVMKRMSKAGEKGIRRHGLEALFSRNK